MFTEHYVYFITSKQYSGPFYTFQAAFNEVVRHQKDARIEDANEKVLATWSTWTGLHKVGAKYKFLVINNEYNQQNCPKLIGLTFNEAPPLAMVQDVEENSETKE